MKCKKCNNSFPEEMIDCSHNVPCYLFEGFNRAQKKNQADKFGRFWLCKQCHKEYEFALRQYLITMAKNYSADYFINK